MGRVLLVRHAQASFGAEDYDRLSETGHEQSRLLGSALAARGLAPRLVVHGGMRRHRETVDGLVAGAAWSSVPVSEEPGWAEFDHLGVLDAVPALPDFQEWFEVATTRWAAGGEGYDETFAAFGERVARALGAALAAVGPVVVVTSGGPVAWAAASLLGVPTAALWQRLNRVCANTGVSLVTSGRSGTNLVTFNEHSHLATPTYR